MIFVGVFVLIISREEVVRELNVNKLRLQIGNEAPHRIHISFCPYISLLCFTLSSQLRSTDIGKFSRSRWGLLRSSRWRGTITLHFLSNSSYMALSFAEYFSCYGMLVHLCAWRIDLLSLRLTLIDQFSLKFKKIILNNQKLILKKLYKIIIKTYYIYNPFMHNCLPIGFSYLYETS